MSIELPNDPIAPTAVDVAASTACTRSGTLALLLSLAMIVLIPYWIERPKRIALAQYVTYRVSLAAMFETLDADPTWQNYKTSRESAELMSISELLNVGVPMPDESTNKPAIAKSAIVAPKNKHGAKPAGPPSSSSAPSPPQLVAAVPMMGLDQMPAIADFLNKLNDPQLLTTA
jgi:hypothetical protein